MRKAIGQTRGSMSGTRACGLTKVSRRLISGTKVVAKLVALSPPHNDSRNFRLIDILIIADLDEIVDIESLRENRKRISKELKVFSLRQDIYNYDITSKVRMNGSPDWLKAKVLSYKVPCLAFDHG